MSDVDLAYCEVVNRLISLAFCNHRNHCPVEFSRATTFPGQNDLIRVFADAVTSTRRHLCCEVTFLRSELLAHKSAMALVNLRVRDAVAEIHNLANSVGESLVPILEWNDLFQRNGKYAETQDSLSQ